MDILKNLIFEQEKEKIKQYIDKTFKDVRSDVFNKKVVAIYVEDDEYCISIKNDGKKLIYNLHSSCLGNPIVITTKLNNSSEIINLLIYWTRFINKYKSSIFKFMVDDVKSISLSKHDITIRNSVCSLIVKNDKNKSSRFKINREYITFRSFSFNRDTERLFLLNNIIQYLNYVNTTKFYKRFIKTFL